MTLPTFILLCGIATFAGCARHANRGEAQP